MGLACWDVLLTTEHAVQEDHKYRALDCHQSLGGPAANAACLLARWGLRTALSARISTDPLGAAILSELREAGVDTSHLRRDAATTALSCVLVNQASGSRTLVNHRPEVVAAVPSESMTLNAGTPRALLVDGHEPGLSHSALDRVPNAISVLDAGSYRAATDELAQRVDHAIVSSAFATAATGEAPSPATLLALSKRYAARVAITLGPLGVLALDDEGRPLHLEPPQVRAVDSTAAGDIFHGAFVWAQLSGRAYLPALRLAMRAAALSVTRPGGRASIPVVGEALAFAPQWWPGECLEKRSPSPPGRGLGNA